MSLNNDNDEQKSFDELLSSLSSSSSHLILHFDINETILVGDEAGGDTREDCLNKMLAKSAFVQIPSSSKLSGNNTEKEKPEDFKKYTLAQTEQITPTHWYDGTPISSTESPPPLYTKWKWPKNCCPYYRTSYKKRSKQFIQKDGQGYKAVYHSLDQTLSIADTQSTSASNLAKHHPFHHMLPSFFHTIYTLQTSSLKDRKYTIVLRTFGSELEDVCKAISDFAKGKHPLYPHFYEPSLIMDGTNNMYCGRWVSNNDRGDEKKDQTEKEENKYHYELYKYNKNFDIGENELVANNDADILKILESNQILGIQDDYRFWSSQNCRPWAGKPVWVVPPILSPSTATATELKVGEESSKALEAAKESSSEVNENKDENGSSDDGSYYHHHIFFDDNIHNDPTDSIVAVRYGSKDNKEEDGIENSDIKFTSLNGEDVIKMQGIHVVKVPTVEPIMDENWFLRQIYLAERNLAAFSVGTNGVVEK